MSAHTPGPWEIFTDYGDATVIKPVGRKGEVAYIQREQFASDDEFEATVYLLFAAPDLLEALEWISKHYANQDINHQDFRVEAYAKALAAIAKATGAQS